MKTYPAHTPIDEIASFDRSTKVEIECPNHPESKWMSKDPWVSQWFPAPGNSDAYGNQITDCGCPNNQYWTSKEYTA